MAKSSRAVDESAIGGMGQVEYRLARDAAVRSFRRGKVGKLDVCDAQTELLRVARNLGQPTEEPCPICDDAVVVHVTFAFGPRLPPGGRVVASKTEFAALARTANDVTFYIVEVCAHCGWNHLVRSFSAQTARKRPTAAQR